LDYVRVAAVRDIEGALEITAPARVAFRDGAVSRVGVPAAGRVASVGVKTGDAVAAGDPLVTIASPDAAATRTALASARAALEEAQAAADREHRMMLTGVGIERERLEAEARLLEARAELDRAQTTADLIGDGHGADLVLKAPISGTVTEVRASRGAAVEPSGEPLVEIGDPHEIWIVADVAGRDLPLIVDGLPATVELDAPAGTRTAHVVSIGPIVSDALRTVAVRLALDAPAAGLRPGTFGRVRIVTSVHGTTLPSEAVLIKGGKDTIVYVATGDDTFERRTVVVGRPVEGRVQVLSGLAPGDRVVVEGALLLDGSAEQLL
jgi:cobalt-zinc-cadmium efflux system membrane fusion protein